MNVLSLKMNARFYPTVEWHDEKMNRYAAKLEHNKDTPLRPFRVKLSKPIGHRIEKRYVFRYAPGETRGHRIDSEAKAHAAMVDHALQRAEAEDLWAAAVEREAQRIAEKEAAEQAAEIESLKASLKPLLGHEDQATRERASLLYHAPDEALRTISRALR